MYIRFAFNATPNPPRAHRPGPTTNMNSALGFGFQPTPGIGQNVQTIFPGSTYGAPANAATGLNVAGMPGSDFLNTNLSDPGQQTNEVIPRHVRMCPDLHPPDHAESVNAIRTLGVGMLLFARKHFAYMTFARNNGDSVKSTYKQTSFVTEDGTSTQYFEWTQMAKWLANHSSMYESAEDVLEEWKFAGGLKNEVTPNTQSTYGKRPHTRLVNTTVRGPFTTFNVWAERLNPGQSLYFIVVKGPVDSCFPKQPYVRVSRLFDAERVVNKVNKEHAEENERLGRPAHYRDEYQMRGFDFHEYWRNEDVVPSATRARLEQLRKSDNDDERQELLEEEVRRVSSYVWKIIPWTHKEKSRPSLSDLTFDDIGYDNDGRPCVVRNVGAFTKVGHVHYSEGRPDLHPDVSLQSMRSEGDFSNTIALFNRGLLNNVEVFLGI